MGNVLPPGGGASGARMAALHSGIPNSASVNTVNRQCSSGLSAVNQIANEILAGQIDIGIGKFPLIFGHRHLCRLTIRRWRRVYDIRVGRCIPS